MIRLRDMRMAPRLIGSFVLVALLTAAVGFAGLHGMNTMEDRLNDIVSNTMPSWIALKGADSAVHETMRYSRGAVLSTDAAQRAALARQAIAVSSETATDFQLYASFPFGSAREAAIAGAVRDELRQWRALDARVAQLAAGGAAASMAEARRISLGPEQRLANTLTASFDVLGAIQQRDAAAATRASRAAHDTAVAQLVAAVVLAVVLAVALGVLIARSVTRPVRRLTEAAERLAGGDLAVEAALPPVSRSETGVLSASFRTMVANLRRLVTELQDGSHNLSSAGGEILTMTSQQASGANEQSAAVAQTTATVDEVKASAEQAVQMAEIVTETAKQANRIAEEGVGAVRRATGEMGEIRQRVQSIADNILALSEQSQQIGEIIATVNDLADQSNLLALNAAIEASRAGEHGRGFTVVASEIRALAEQSKAATAQVRTLLSDIQRATNAAVMATEQGTKGVDAGVAVIDQAGRTIDELAATIQQAAQSAAQIAASVWQHSVGMEQVAAAMSNINQATTQNLAATQNTQQAAQHLTDLAGRLRGMTAQYQL